MSVATILLAALVTFLASAVLAGLIMALDRWLPAYSLRERHDASLAALIVIPLVFAVAAQAGPQRTAPPAPPIIAGEALATDAVTTGTGALNQPDTQTVAQADTGAGFRAPDDSTLVSVLSPLGKAMLLVWLAGTVLMSARLARDLMALARLRSGARRLVHPLAARFSTHLPLAVSDGIGAPVMAGYRQPQILLPAGFTLDETALPVIEHEIAHARRGDAWTVLALRMLQVVFWWAVPINALLDVLDRSREALCDRAAARMTGRPRALALALIDAAAATVRTPGLALASTPTRSNLAHRVGRLTAADILHRKDSPMRITIILPALAATALVLTPHVGEAPAQASVMSDRGPVRDLDDRFDVDAHLFQAARRGRADTVIGLLAEGANPNVRFQGDGTALIAAVRSGDQATVEALLASGADPDLGVDGDGNPLITAAAHGRENLLNLLLERGATVDAGQSGDGNALIAAALHGRLSMVDRLLAAGANPDGFVFGDETPLVNAAQQGHLDVIERLVSAGADISLTVRAPQRNGTVGYRSPLSEARRTGHREVAAWLEARGAEHREPTR